jgi:hypothetical protein
MGCAMATTGIGCGERSGDTAVVAAGNVASPRKPVNIAALRNPRMISSPVEWHGRDTIARDLTCAGRALGRDGRFQVTCHAQLAQME